MNFKKNLFSNLITQVISILIGFLTSILIARGLGVVNQGYFTFYLLIFGLIASYGNLSITSSNSYFIKKSKYDRNDVISNNVTILLILNIIYIILSILFTNIIFNSNANKYLLLIIWLVYSSSLMFFNYFTTIHVVDETIYLYNRYSIYTNVLKCILIIVLYFSDFLNIISISITYSIMELLKLILIKKGLKLNIRLFISFDLLKQELIYGIPLYLAALFIYFNYRADLFMVKAMQGDFQLGIYSIAVHLAELAFLFPSSIVSAFEGKLYSCSDDTKKNVTEQIIKITFYVTSIICLIGILCKPLIVFLYGKEYAPAGVCMIILLIGIAFASIGKIAPVYFYTQGKPKIHLLVSSLVLIINIASNCILIPKFGIKGAALASTISYIFYGITYIVLLTKSGIDFKNMLKIKKGDFKYFKSLILEKKSKKAKDNESDIKRCIFHIPCFINTNHSSGSQIRPIKMIKAFEESGYQVDIIMGYGKERKQQISKIKENINNGIKYDFLYSESSTMPTLLTEKNHFPRYPFLDFGFFKFCKKNNIKIGLFYRDIYWKFDSYKSTTTFFKRFLAIIFYKYDLLMYRKILDVLYLPSNSFKKYLPVKNQNANYKIELLPPGCNEKVVKKVAHKDFNIFYVGGISNDIYNLELIFEFVNKYDKVNLIVCCREEEWNKYKNTYDKYISPRIKIIHEKNLDLNKYYASADLCCLFFKNNPYRDMATPIKLFEYIENEVPIISTSNTEASKFIQDNDIGFICNYDEISIENQIEKILENKKIIENKEKKIVVVKQENTWKKRVEKVINDLIQK